MTTAVFFDRDGVLNEIVERDGKPASPRTPEELVVAADAPQVLSRLREMGFKIFVVTNQPDVRRGLMSDANQMPSMPSFLNSCRLMPLPLAVTTMPTLAPVANPSLAYS